MARTSRPATPASEAPESDAGASPPRPPRSRPRGDSPRDGAGEPSLAGLGIAGVSRRRIVGLAGLGLALWIGVGFAGQATDAARAAERASQETATNAALANQLAGLDDELDLVVQRRWFLQQARAYDMGTAVERPFALDPAAPTLPPDAPGSPGRRLGTEVTTTTPLDSWLDVLFGPAPGV